MSDEPTITGLLEKQITTLEQNLNRRLDLQDVAQAEFKAETRLALSRIESKVDKTNGRVTVLERARDRAQGVMFAFKWVPPLLAAAVTAGLTILTLALTGQIH